MAYITRDDGVQFVVPSYRDVLTMKSASALKKEILALSSNYGEYITLQQKSAIQYEIAFSPDVGYLLGESIWHQLKRPIDMVYCEAIPNTAEAILVIVVSGGVYLDGRFQLDSIPDELIVFLTQKNSFDVYIYGDVPISQQPEAGKFNFEADSIKSFTVLEEPLFPTLPLIRSYQLQLVATVLKENKIGVLPIKKMVIGGIIAAALYFMWTLMSPKQVEEVKVTKKAEVNPYLEFNRVMTSPDPKKEFDGSVEKLQILFSMPGWEFTEAIYAAGVLSAKVTSKAPNLAVLRDWAKRMDASVSLSKTNVLVSLRVPLTNRSTPKSIYPVNDVIMNLLDKIGSVTEGNVIKFGGSQGKGLMKKTLVEIKIDKKSIIALGLIGKQFEGLPLVLKSVQFKSEKTRLISGKILIDVVGN